MNLEAVLPALRRAGLLLDHTPRGIRFQRLTACLLQTLSDSAAIPALSAGDIQRYSTLALLHDIGMRAVPREILEKPGSLTREEFLTVKAHTTQGSACWRGCRSCESAGCFPMSAMSAVTTMSGGTAPATRTGWPGRRLPPGSRR